MASLSTPRGQALPEQREAGERLRWNWLPYKSRCRGSRSPMPWAASSRPGRPRCRMPGLVSARLLFAAPALTSRDQPHYLVGTHAAHGSGGVHRPEDNAATPQQELRRLDEAAFAIPPCTEQIGLLPRHAVCNREGKPPAHHLPRLLQGVDAGGIDGGPKSFQLRFLFLIRG
jgi:hypothetical protein